MSNAEWDTLLTWLDSKGHDRATLKVQLQSSQAGGGRRLVALEDIHPEQVLIQLPHSCLLNKATIAPLYPSIKPEQITAYQLLAIHLSLNRHKTMSAKGQAEAEAFIPYIRTLPQDFSTVPLWREVVEDKAWEALSEGNGLLPYGLVVAAKEVSGKFWKDWTAAQAIWKKATPSLDLKDFAWAWLCINSRCIYYDLELPSREDNITLAPIIDMGNHSSKRPTKIVDYDDHFSLVSSGPEHRQTYTNNREPLTKKGSEIMYSYSAMSDYALMAEYGFVLGIPQNSDSVLNVTDRVFKLFDALPPEEYTLKKETLEANKYWGEYHLTYVNGEVDISYRLTIALALYHMQRVPNTKSPVERRQSPRKRVKQERKGEAKNGVDEPADWNFQPFYDMVAGIREDLGEANVRSSLATIAGICQGFLQSSEIILARIDALFHQPDALIGMIKVVVQGELWFVQKYLEQSGS